MLLVARNLLRQIEGRRLLDDCSLEIRGGDKLALVGPSGSGKSLLMRALAMLDPLDEGTIHWRGERVMGSGVPVFRARVVYLHQRPPLAGGSVEDELRRPFSFTCHRDKRFDRERVIDWLSVLERDESFLAKQVRDLSGGEAQITALLRAIQLDPSILLLDEATSALDKRTTQLVESLVADWWNLHSDGRATMWVSHDRDQIARVSNGVIEISGGKTTCMSS